MDDIDRRILDILQRDAKISQARIAETVGLTTPSVNERIKKLETRGFIRRFTALLDPRLVGMPLVAHVDVLLEHPRFCLLYTSPSPRDRQKSRMPSSA